MRQSSVRFTNFLNKEEIYLRGGCGRGKKLNRVRTIFQEEGSGRGSLKTKLSVLKTGHQLHLGGGGGGLLAGLLGLGLGGGGRLVLSESKACCAEEERKAEHRGHDLFHRCVSP